MAFISAGLNVLSIVLKLGTIGHVANNKMELPNGT